MGAPDLAAVLPSAEPCMVTAITHAIKESIETKKLYRILPEKFLAL